MEKEFNAVQNKQREIINRDINTLKSNLAETSNNLANIFDVFDVKLNSTQEKQLELTSKVTNVANDFKLLDQQIETVQQKQMELSHLGEGNSQKINVLWTNLTDDINRLERKLNSTQEKQSELASRVRNHGHGNKESIDQLTSKITNFTNDFETLDQQVRIDFAKMTDRLTNTIGRIDGEKKKNDVLWIEYLADRKRDPIFQKYGGSYATFYKENRTQAILNETELFTVNGTEYNEIMLNIIPDFFITSKIRLRSIDDNWKKVRNTQQSVASNNSYFTLGSFDGKV